MSQPIPSETIEYERFVDKLRKSNAAMLEALHQAREHITGQIDFVDGDYGVPAPNAAMRLAQEIDAAITLAEHNGTARPPKTITNPAAEIERLQKALEFYRDADYDGTGFWDGISLPGILSDKGSTAKQALAIRP